MRGRLPFAAPELKPALTPAQERRRAEIDARNEAIQKAGLKPPDGVTFAKKPGK